MRRTKAQHTSGIKKDFHGREWRGIGQAERQFVHCPFRKIWASEIRMPCHSGNGTPLQGM